jgi:cation transport ATPase
MFVAHSAKCSQTSLAAFSRVTGGVQGGLASLNLSVYRTIRDDEDHSENTVQHSRPRRAARAGDSAERRSHAASKRGVMMHASETNPEAPPPSRAADRVTRVLLWLLALVELVVGTLALISAIQIFRAPDAGLALIFAPVFAILALFLVAGAAIFVRRPWGRMLHIAILLLIGALLVLYVGPLLGPLGWLQVLAAVLIVVVPLTWIFRLAPVRRYLGGTGENP